MPKIGLIEWKIVSRFF